MSGRRKGKAKAGRVRATKPAKASKPRNPLATALRSRRAGLKPSARLYSRKGRPPPEKH